MKRQFTLEQVEEMYGFLQGREIDGITCKAMPSLSHDQAFSVIYILQEHFHVFPDTFEACQRCGGLIDTESEGYYVEDIGHWCDGCSIYAPEPARDDNNED